MKKKLITCLLCFLLAFSLSLPSFAIEYNPDGTGDWIRGWVGSGQTALLMGNGVNAPVIVGTNTSTGKDHVWGVVKRGADYTLETGPASNTYCVNMYRVLQNGIYYNCTGYYYENATGGRDQRVQLLQYNGYTIVRLSSPIVGGTWYMVADYSSPVSSSSVIWYTDPNGIKARWN